MQTVTRETAKLMKEKGWVKETYWFYRTDTERLVQSDLHPTWKNLYPNDWLPAPTLDEVLEELPIWTSIIKQGNEYSCVAEDKNIQIAYSTNPADAAAEVWLGKEAP